MAAAAWFMFGATVLNLIVAAVTGYIVWRTLQANNTVIGQSAAQLANSKTQLDNSAAELALARAQAEEARRFGRLSHRAYIAIEDFWARKEEDPLGRKGPFWRIGATVTNRGATPATDVVLSLQVQPVGDKSSDQPWPAADEKGSRHRGIIQPGGWMKPNKGATYAVELLDSIWDQKAALHVTVMAIYSDVFGFVHERRASYLFTGRDLFKQFPTDAHNDERVLSSPTAEAPAAAGSGEQPSQV